MNTITNEQDAMEAVKQNGLDLLDVRKQTEGVEVGTMKTTIKASWADVVVAPNRACTGYVDLTLWGEINNKGFRPSSGVSLSQDQVGALLFALEQAAEAAQLAKKPLEFGLVGTRDSVQAMEDRMAA